MLDVVARLYNAVLLPSVNFVLPHLTNLGRAGMASQGSVLYSPGSLQIPEVSNFFGLSEITTEKESVRLRD